MVDIWGDNWFWQLFAEKLQCPHCGFKFRYNDYPESKKRNDGVCPNCNRGHYVGNRLFWRFPAKVVNGWIIMPICEVCGVRPSVLYDANDCKMKCSEDAYALNVKG